MYKRKWQKSLIEGYKSSNFSLIEGFFGRKESHPRFLLYFCSRAHKVLLKYARKLKGKQHGRKEQHTPIRE